MQPDAIKPEPEDESPGANVKAPTTTNQANGRPATGKAAQNGTSNGQFPPPKTDKPRPHVCTTCGRSFARLEHLKRHERSHTKEKPFECPECTRCFARRDLLLRHQQKLHMTNATTRPRQGRRESVGGPGVNGNSKVRKNSVANANVGGAAGNIAQGRPRANTISHIDMASLGIFDGNNPHVNRLNALGLTGLHGGHMGMNRIPGAGNFDYRGMSTAIGLHGNIHGLPKLDTHINNMDMSNSLQTAPPRANFGGFDIDQLFTPHTTINPAALHFGGAGSIQSSNIPFGFDPSTNQQVPIDDDFTWMRNWNMQLGSGNDNDQAIDESSPSRVSSGDSPGDFSENMSNSQTAMPIRHNSYQWPQHEMQQQQNIPGGPFQLEALGTGLPILESANGTISPSSLHDPTPTGDAYFHQAMMQQPGQQTHHQHLQSLSEIMHSQNGATTFGHALSNFDSNSPSIASSSMAGSARQSSVTSMSTDSITDSTRQALLSSLAQPSVVGGHNHRKYSQPSVSSPLSPAARSNMHSQGPNLPGTADIKRYIEAFIHFAHPHLPIAHLATLSFDVIETNSVSRGSPPSTTSSQNAFTGGARCLILGMAAIGALYEYDHPASKDLFEAAKKMIQLYLEERRKADISAAANGSNAAGETPLWLVQAMLLTVIYGHHCGDRIAADIASNHIAALVSLARAAHLAQPRTEGSPSTTGEGLGTTQSNGDVDMGGHTATNGTSNHETDLHTQWIKWKTGEERKRCLFAIFILSSLLTTAYNQTPTIMNSEILLDLPCAEELYEARSAEEWQARGGLAASEASSISFASALSFLLTASQRQGNNFAPSAYNSCSETGALQSGEEELKPSTFGCHVLINALHNYIWETRSRHTNKDWTVQETESMVTNIEPALNAWQVAWKANKQHRLERPNPYGCGPLSADSIPLLDLAFVRLYVNLGRTAEAFWRRDFDQMAEELAGGGECEGGTSDRKARMGPASAKSSPAALRGAPQLQGDDDQASTRRERHLRKAAYYSADALTIACSYNMTYADPTAHELPIQSAICFFDCTQVLAEWCTTIQERAGRYLGILGRDEIDYSQVPAIMLLENEDVELLRKIESICNSLEEKRMQQENLLMMDPQHGNGTTASLTNGVDLSSCGLGSKVLRVTAMMLEKAVIWPITHVMAKALETEASHMDRRAAASCTQ